MEIMHQAHGCRVELNTGYWHVGGFTWWTVQMREGEGEVGTKDSRLEGQVYSQAMLASKGVSIYRYHLS